MVARPPGRWPALHARGSLEQGFAQAVQQPFQPRLALLQGRHAIFQSLEAVVYTLVESIQAPLEPLESLVGALGRGDQDGRQRYPHAYDR